MEDLAQHQRTPVSMPSNSGSTSERIDWRGKTELHNEIWPSPVDVAVVLYGMVGQERVEQHLASVQTAARWATLRQTKSELSRFTLY